MYFPLKSRRLRVTLNIYLNLQWNETTIMHGIIVIETLHIRSNRPCQILCVHKITNFLFSPFNSISTTQPSFLAKFGRSCTVSYYGVSCISSTFFTCSLACCWWVNSTFFEYSKKQRITASIRSTIWLN